MISLKDCITALFDTEVNPEKRSPDILKKLTHIDFHLINPKKTSAKLLKYVRGKSNDISEIIWFLFAEITCTS